MNTGREEARQRERKELERKEIEARQRIEKNEAYVGANQDPLRSIHSQGSS